MSEGIEELSIEDLKARIPDDEVWRSLGAALVRLYQAEAERDEAYEQRDENWRRLCEANDRLARAEAVVEAARRLHEAVEMAESVGEGIPERAPSLLLGEALSTYDEAPA